MVQEIIVGIIGLLVVGYIAYKIYKLIFAKSEDSTMCGCGSCHCNNSKKIK